MDLIISHPDQMIQIQLGGFPDGINVNPGPSNLGPNLIFLDPEPLRGSGLYIFTMLIADLDDIHRLFLDTDPCVTQRLNSDIVYIFFPS